ncbi:ATP-binding cassette domain-containing protein [Alkalibaculum sp. M08DMB]|uniref:ATP-binding cassette domain-containing protein n=2 Tax=Alkalibaculum sporogenes TaxID=2655001 RepID=A0A6A7K9L3_9FIRM|nr:ABC transporter ATP-binding protein [Alkalibaculum sporogenes]MPW26219.1 ATP-binding cassette domain-containing protein [Alkalibaculum sporogenes]
MENIIVKMNHISKSFGSVKALNKVNLELFKGEVHSLLGENGAGKSSLMNILSGIYMPDEGELSIKGKDLVLRSPKDAIDLGIGMIHQHFKLVEVLTAKENIIAGYNKGIFVKHEELSKKIKETSAKYGLEIDPDKKVYNMSVAEKQRVEILKVLYRGADILILDEPTAVLTPQETEGLFDIVRNMTKHGCAVVIITHKLNEVMEISDKITILRKGESIRTVLKEETDVNELTELMVGRAVDLSIQRAPLGKRKKVMEIKNMTVLNFDKTKAVDNISFDMLSGEILGVAGIAGSGQKELCESLAGLMHIHSGDVIYRGNSLKGKNPADIIRMGISMSFVPEDRLGMGLVGSMDIVDNVLLKEYQKTIGFMLKKRTSKEKAQTIVDALNISTPSTDKHPVKLLSGGNIQKVLLGREIAANPEVIITAYPSRGLDIGSSMLVYDLLNEQKQKEVAILYIGEDLDVLMELCDRIMVLYNGTITGIVDAKTSTREQLGLLMSGVVEDNLDENS